LPQPTIKVGAVNATYKVANRTNFILGSRGAVVDAGNAGVLMERDRSILSVHHDKSSTAVRWRCSGYEYSTILVLLNSGVHRLGNI
jgi:hypothetical protein